MNKLVLAVVIIIIIIIIVIVVAMPKLPKGVSNGDNVTCEGLGKYYKIENGKKRWYVWEAWVKAGQPTLKYISCADLNSIPTGPDM